MATLTIRLPDDKHERLKQLAQTRGVSVNKLMEEFSTKAIAEFDAFNRFQVMASKGDIKQGLALLDKLDSDFTSL